MDPLAAHFLQQGIPEAELSEIVSAFQFKKIKKGSYFAEEGKTSKHLAFITKGLFQYFYLKDGKEVTTYVTGENTFLASLSSFYKQKPCKEFVRALLDAELLMIHYNDLVAAGSFAKARETGKLRLEGKDYEVDDGDVILFRFNV